MHESQVLVLDHRLVALCNLLVVLEVDELLERAQVLVQVSLDLRLRFREVSLVRIIQFGETKVGLYLVDSLLDEGASFLAHDVKEEELEVAFICRYDSRYKLLLDKLADTLKVDQVSLEWRILHLKHVE